VGDTVRVTKEGKFKGNQGIIKHIFKNYLFIHSPNYKSNGGIFVTTARHCLIMGVSKNQTMGGVHGKNATPKTRIHAPSRQRINVRNDANLHKQVTIIEGNWRGYVGVVKDVSKDTYTIVLQINAQRIQVPKNQVESNEAKLMPQSPMSNIHKDVSTPSMARSNIHKPTTPNNPNNVFNPGRTPVPSTPGNEDWNENRNDDSQEDESSFTNDYQNTRYPVSTPGLPEDIITSPIFGHSSTPNTPGFATHPTTPGYSSVPTTPGYTPIPNTPGFSQIPPTTPGGYKPTTPGGFQHTSPIQDEDSVWWCPNIEVEYDGKIGVITNVFANECTVRWLDNNTNTIEGSLLKPIVPKKKEKVIVIRGKSKGKKGEFIHGDQNEGIVKGDELMEIFPIQFLAKYVG